MRVLLDECMPRKLKSQFTGHDVRTVPELGWASKKNGELLQLAAGRFDVLITVDRNFTYQQNLSGLSIAVVSLTARSNRLPELLPLMPEVRRVLLGIRPGEVRRVGV